MDKRRIVQSLALVVLLVISGRPLWAQTSSAEEAQKAKVVKMEIVGTSLEEQEKLLQKAKILTQLERPVSEEIVASDARSIYALGYFQEVTGEIIPTPEGVKVIFNVVENPRLQEIIIKGNTVFSQEEILGRMKTKKGKILNYNDLQEDLKNIETLYQDKGFSLAKIVDAETDPKASLLSIEIVEGEVEEILIEGNTATKDYVIRRELTNRPGQPLNTELLREDLQNIFNLGYFKTVVPNIQPGADPKKVVLIITVEEQRASSFNAGGGYGQREGWFAFADVNLENLFGTGQSVLLRGQFGQNLSNYQFRYQQPWLLPDHTSFTFRRWYTIGKDIFLSDQNEIRNGWDISLGKPLTRKLRGAVTFKSEDVTPETDPFYRINSGALSLSYDTRDVWANPHQGQLYTASTEIAGGLFGGTLSFQKYGLDLNHFFPLAPKQTLALHLGGNLARGDMRPEEKYWLGGPYTVRGYNDTVTGVRRVLFNIEYRYDFTDIFQGVLFFDAGKIWDFGPYEAVKRAGKGFGVRLNTPLGPIRLDYGIADYKNFGQGVYSFSIGQTF